MLLDHVAVTVFLELKQLRQRYRFCFAGPVRAKGRPNISIYPAPAVVELSSDSESEAPDLSKEQPKLTDRSEQTSKRRKMNPESERLKRELVKKIVSLFTLSVSTF